jgi:hypothetical protein
VAFILQGLCVNQLSGEGCLRPGCSSSCRWIVGNEVFSIKLHAEPERLLLSYSVQVGDGGREAMTEVIPIVNRPCRFGGRRPFFICPGPRNGTDCGRRTTKLHLSDRYFLCRHCNKLAYASQYEEPWKRALRRANKLKQRLGIDVGIDEPFPDKPKGMWSRTYGRRLDEILQAEILANEAQAKRFQRLTAQLQDDLE